MPGKCGFEVGIAPPPLESDIDIKNEDFKVVSFTFWDKYFFT